MIAITPAHLSRYKDIALLLWKYGRSDLVTEAGLDEAIDSKMVACESSAGPDQLAHDLEQLGPTFVKLGQVLSARADLLPQPYLDALTRLQDDVAPVPFKHIEQTIEQELGVKIPEIFAYFEAEPLAAASLGQVHRATLSDGSQVAVKVQRPGVREQVACDLDSLAELAAILDRHTAMGKRYQFSQIVDSLRRCLNDELDYRREANHCRELADNLAGYEEDLVLPRVYEAASSSRVLTMEFLPGTKISEVSKCQLEDIDAPRLAKNLFRAYLQQVLLDGIFHADPHAGNISLLPDGRLALMDFGMTIRVQPDMRQQLAQILLNVSENRGGETAKHVLEISRIGDDVDRRRFSREISSLVDEHHSRPVKDLRAGAIVLNIQEIASRCGVQLPDELRMIGKTLLHLDEIVGILDPEFDPNAAVRREASELIRQRMSDHVSLSNLYQSLTESVELTQAAPARLNKFTQRLADNELRLRVDAIDQSALMNTLHQAANRITTGLILAALIVGASLMMRLQTQFTILGYPGIAMIFFLIAAIAGLVLVYRIAFHDGTALRT